MKRLHKGEVFEVISESGGMVYAFRAPLAENVILKENELPVNFNYYNYVAGNEEKVKRDIYQLAKFGANYSKIIKKCDNYVFARSVLLSDGKVFLVEMDGRALLFDAKGEVLWSGNMKYKNKVPSSVAVAKNGLWGSFPELDAVIRFNATTMRSELRIGKKGDLFNSPEGLYAEGNDLFVCSSGSRKIIKIDLDTLEAEDIYGFNEPVRFYKKTKIGEIVLLDSGLYIIE